MPDKIVISTDILASLYLEAMEERKRFYEIFQEPKRKKVKQIKK